MVICNLPADSPDIRRAIKNNSTRENVLELKNMIPDNTFIRYMSCKVPFLKKNNNYRKNIAPSELRTVVRMINFTTGVRINFPIVRFY